MIARSVCFEELTNKPEPSTNEHLAKFVLGNMFYPGLSTHVLLPSVTMYNLVKMHQILDPIPLQLIIWKRQKKTEGR